MNLLKQGLALFIIALFFNACTQDNNNCTPPLVEQNILGSWFISGGVSGVEFQANGTLIDPDHDLFSGGIINGDTLSVKTYSISNDTLYVVAASATSTNTRDAQFYIDHNECDKITLSILGLSFNYSRVLTPQ